MRHLAGSVLALLVTGTSPALAHDPFRLDLEVNGQTGSRGFTTLNRVYDFFSDAALRSLVPSYTNQSPANITVDLRGVTGFASFAANSPALRLVVPSAGVDRTFNGATRQESRDLLLRFLRDGSNGGSDRVLRAAVRSTATDPVSGNPNAALPNLAISDYGRALSSAFGLDRVQGGLSYGVGARFGSFTAAGYDSQTVTVPLDLTWNLSPRDTLELDIPLAYTDNSGATSYSGNLGILYRRQVTPNWTLQPSFRIGGVGSLDLGSGSGVYGVGLVSTLRFDLPQAYRLTVANSVNHVGTFPVSAGGFSVDYGVANTIFRNGFVVTRDLGFEVMGREITGSAFAVDTRFTGSPTFVRNFQEFGVFVSAGREARGGLGLSVLTGDRGLFGITLSTGVKF